MTAVLKIWSEELLELNHNMERERDIYIYMLFYIYYIYIYMFGGHLCTWFRRWTSTLMGNRPRTAPPELLRIFTKEPRPGTPFSRRADTLPGQRLYTICVYIYIYMIYIYIYDYDMIYIYIYIYIHVCVCVICNIHIYTLIMKSYVCLYIYIYCKYALKSCMMIHLSEAWCLTMCAI